MGRKRGRRRKAEEVTTVDDDNDPNDTALKSNKKQKSSDNFKCSECDNGFETEAEADRHVLHKHYGLARINDDSKTPFTDKEIVQALIKAQKKLKVLKCKNDGCNKTFKSGLGLKTHLDLCGKSEADTCVTCEVCGKVLKKGSMGYHSMTHSTKVVKETHTDVNNVEEAVTTANSRKRASAIRAQKTIRKSTIGDIDEPSDDISDEEFKFNPSDVEEEEGDEDQQAIGDSVSEEITELHAPKQNIEQHFKTLITLWSEFITSIDDSLRDLPETCENWAKDVRKKGKVKCPLKGCSQSFTTVSGLKYHYKRCGIELKYLWKCKICGYEAIKGNRLIIQHLWQTHKESVPEISSELAEIIETATIKPSVNVRGKRCFQTRKLVLEFHQTFYTNKSFPDLKPMPNCWSILSQNEHRTYIPDPKPSIHFKSTLSKSSSWNQLNLFESVVTEPHINFYVGGPVWAIAWCPLPLDAGEQSDQFLAIASNMNPEISHTLNDTDFETGLIQIWNVGPLTSKFNASLKPKLELAVAHSCGMVWDMEWCPGGTTYEPMTSAINCGPLLRLGLLAIACANGFVHVHSIPHPQSLDKPQHYPLYKNEPVVILNPPGVGPSVNNEETICKCVSWIHSHNQHLIAAGYGSGLIAVWDLNTKSSLLTVQRNQNKLILKPLISWFGHSAVVNRIRWFQCSAQFLITCSFDRSAKLWNLSDTAAPVSVLKKGLITALDTHPQWNGMFLAHDDCYLPFQSPIYFKDFGFHNFGSISLINHKSCIWDLSVSQWTSVMASVDAAGEAIVYPNFKFVADPKRKTYDKIPLYHINYVPLDEKSSSKSKKKPKKIDTVVECHSKPPIRTYNEFHDKCGIVFNDFYLREEKDIPIDEINRIRLTAHMQYQRLNDFPLLSINRVSWNPNQWSECWIVSATQSGICRLSCLPMVAHNQRN